MPQPAATTRTDFDRIALLTERSGWSHNDHYHNFLLSHVPRHCKAILEIGCGTGAFSRALAARSSRAVALDLSPEMVRIARERSRQHTNIDFHIADALEWEFPPDHFDCVVSIATLHHLPMEAVLPKIKRTLKTNGVLIILDLYQAQGLADMLTSVLAVPVNLVLGLIKRGRLREPREVREAWAEHGRHDSYLTLSQIHRICASTLPGAKVRKHLLWRYSIIWKKDE
jgi:ubiquinone/menaquinone biosynthesis C-methylase UbiE